MFFIHGRQTILLPELPACSVIVMDNASFHKRQDTLDALQAEGHTVLWLPPYSPDFNPIEKTWAWIKRLRKQWRLADVNALLFWFFILVTQSKSTRQPPQQPAS